MDNQPWRLWVFEKEFWRESPYYSSKILSSLYTEQIEKKYWLSWYETVIRLDLEEEKDWKKLLKWEFDITISWKNKIFKFDFSDSKWWLPIILNKVLDEIEQFVRDNTEKWKIDRILKKQ